MRRAGRGWQRGGGGMGGSSLWLCHGSVWVRGGATTLIALCWSRPSPPPGGWPGFSPEALVPGGWRTWSCRREGRHAGVNGSRPLIVPHILAKKNMKRLLHTLLGFIRRARSGFCMFYSPLLGEQSTAQWGGKYQAEKRCTQRWNITLSLLWLST